MKRNHDIYKDISISAPMANIKGPKAYGPTPEEIELYNKSSNGKLHLLSRKTKAFILLTIGAITFSLSGCGKDTPSRQLDALKKMHAARKKAVVENIPWAKNYLNIETYENTMNDEIRANGLKEKYNDEIIEADIELEEAALDKIKRLEEDRDKSRLYPLDQAPPGAGDIIEAEFRRVKAIIVRNVYGNDPEDGKVETHIQNRDKVLPHVVDYNEEIELSKK